MNATAATVETVKWFKENEPFIYRVAVKKLMMKNAKKANQLHGMGAIDWGGMLSSLTSTVSSLGSTYLQAKQQKEIMDMQLDRARQGLPPADVAAYTPAIKISPQITPETEQAITRVATQTAKNTFEKYIPIGLGLLGLFLVLRSRKS